MRHVDGNIGTVQQPRTAADLRAAIVDRGSKLAGQYAPDHVFHAPLDDIGALILAECQRYPDAPLDQAGFTCQVNEETAGMQSTFWLERANPGGIGAVDNDPNQAVDFTDDGKIPFHEAAKLGLQAHGAHLRDYRYGLGSWTVNDVRAKAMPKGWFGSCQSWAQLKGKWATSQTYDQSIEAIWQRLDIVATGSGWVDGKPDDARFALFLETAHEYGYPDGTPGRGGQPIELGVLHYTAGHDSLEWLRGNHSSSCTYLTDRQGFPRAQILYEKDAPWAGGSEAYNRRGIHFEFEKLQNEPWVEECVRNFAFTCQPVMDKYGVPPLYLARDNGPGKLGYIGHHDIPDGHGGWGGSTHHHDPGTAGDPDGGPAFPWDMFIHYATQAQTRPPQPTAPLDRLVMPPLEPTPRDGKLVPYVFGKVYDAKGGVETFGLFVSGVFVEDSKLVQYTEGYRFEYQPAAASSVERGLLGNEVLAVRYPNGAPA